MRAIHLCALIVLSQPCINSVSAKEYRLQSPSGNITANIDCGDELIIP